MDTFQKINEIIDLCREKRIKCHLDSGSNNYEDKYVPLGDRMYDTIKEWSDIGGGNLLKGEITDITSLWAKLSDIKTEKDYIAIEKKFNTLLGKGDEKIKSFTDNEATAFLTPFIEKTAKVYSQLMQSEGYSNIPAATIEEANALFKTMLENMEKVVDGQSKHAADLLDRIHTTLVSFRSNITSRNYVNNNALKEACDLIAEWSDLEHVKDKLSKEMTQITAHLKQRSAQQDEFEGLEALQELKQRCANLFANLDEKYTRVNNAALEHLTTLSAQLQQVTDEIAKVQADIKARYKAAPEALRETVKMTGYAALRPLEEKKKRLERELNRGIGRIDDPGITAFNRFYEMMSGIRDIYNDCAEFEMSYFNMIFSPLLERDRDGTTPFDVLNAMIGSSRITDAQYAKIFQWININVPVMRESYYSACQILNINSEDYMREFNPAALEEPATTWKQQMGESMSFLDEEEAPKDAVESDLFDLDFDEDKT